MPDMRAGCATVAQIAGNSCIFAASASITSICETIWWWRWNKMLFQMACIYWNICVIRVLENIVKVNRKERRFSTENVIWAVFFTSFGTECCCNANAWLTLRTGPYVIFRHFEAAASSLRCKISAETGFHTSYHCVMMNFWWVRSDFEKILAHHTVLSISCGSWRAYDEVD